MVCIAASPVDSSRRRRPHALALGLLRFFGHQDWIRYGVRDRVIRRCCNPDHVERHDFEIDYFGLRYRGTLDSFLDWTVYFYGAHEKYDLRVLEELIRGVARPVFIDIGANVGLHSLFMSRHCDVVHAFEPHVPLVEEFTGHLERNDIRNVTIHTVALGSDEGERDFFAPRGANRGTGSFLRSHATDNNAFLTQLPVVNADRYIGDLRLDHIDLIKIDVEGVEREVLSGLKQTLARCRPVVFMEFSPEIRDTFADADDLLAMLPPAYTVRSVRTYETYGVFFGAPVRRYVEFDFDVPRGNLVLGPQERPLA